MRAVAKQKDDNERLKAGTLPLDPEEDCEPFNDFDEVEPETKGRPSRTRVAVDDDRLEVELTREISPIVDGMERALRRDESVFVRDTSLGRLDRSLDGQLRWRPLQHAALREVIDRNARFFNWGKETNDDGEEKWIQRWKRPPESECATLAQRARWPHLRPLRRIVSAPFLRADASVCQAAGYDDASQTFGDFREDDFDAVPLKPTRADASRALSELRALFVDFPFRSEADRFVPIALLLSLVGRDAIHGPVPMTMVTAATKGTGKTKLVDVVSNVAAGRPCIPTTLPRNDEEWPKTLLTIAKAAPTLVNFDNLTNGAVFGHPQLDSLLTSGAMQGRALGANDMIDVQVPTVFAATANNPRYGSDLVRRVIPCRLETTLERPEERTDYQIPQVEAHALKHRGKLLCSALTVLAAYNAAGRPSVAGTLGSFEAWAAIVRAAIVWAGGPDILETRRGIESDDDELGTLDDLLRALQASFGTSPFAVRDMLSRFSGGEGADVLASFCPGKQPPSSRSLGRRLAAIRGRIVRGLRLVPRSENRNGVLWAIESVTNTGE